MAEGRLDRKKTVVIGAGPGGLAAAMLLAAAGTQVTVFEKDGAVGGRTKTFGADGFRFDVGPTFFLYPQILESLFVRCGLRMEDYIALRRVDPSYKLAFEGGPDIHVCGDMEKLEREIARLNLHDARAIRRFIDANRKKLAAFTPILQRPFQSLLDYLAPGVLSALRYILPLGSVDDELKKYFQDPRVRLAFSFQTKYLGMSPFRCPNLFTFLAFLEFEFGIWHPVGGCGAVSEGMAKAAKDLGVDIRLNEPVEAFGFERRRAVAVKTKSGYTPTDACVINADFAHAAKSLIPNSLRRKWTDKKIDGMKYSCSTYMLYLGVSGTFDRLDHHTIFLARDYAKNISQIEDATTVPNEPSIYVCNPARTDPAFAENGNASLYVLVPVGNCGAIDWSKESQNFRNSVIQRLESFGLENLSQRIRYEKIVTPDQWRDNHSIYRGATFNFAHGLDQMLYFRPHNRFEDIDGVYLVGGGTHPGSGLPVIYESARISSDLVLTDLGLANRIPGPEEAPRPLEQLQEEVAANTAETSASSRS